MPEASAGDRNSKTDEESVGAKPMAGLLRWPTVSEIPLLLRPHQQRRRDRETEGLSGLMVDDKLDLERNELGRSPGYVPRRNRGHAVLGEPPLAGEGPHSCRRSGSLFARPWSAAALRRRAGPRAHRPARSAGSGGGPSPGGGADAGRESNVEDQATPRTTIANARSRIIERAVSRDEDGRTGHDAEPPDDVTPAARGLVSPPGAEPRERAL